LSTPEEILEKFIINDVINRINKNELLPEEDLLKSGIIDSMAIIKLVSFIEETFNIRIAEEDLIPENFQNIRSMAGYIEQCVGR
jgi:acyl carrier protein